jgi:hypothetical protein
LEADIPASCTDTLFSKPPQSGKAEKETIATNGMIFHLWAQSGMPVSPLHRPKADIRNRNHRYAKASVGSHQAM